MPNNSPLADTILKGDQALAACAANADILPSGEKYRAPLEIAMTELKAINVRQQTLIADKQQVTQDQKAAVSRVKDLLIHLKAAVRSDIGPRSEKLVEWNVTPLRPRSRRTGTVEVIVAKP